MKLCAALLMILGLFLALNSVAPVHAAMIRYEVPITSPFNFPSNTLGLTLSDNIIIDIDFDYSRLSDEGHGVFHYEPNFPGSNFAPSTLNVSIAGHYFLLDVKYLDFAFYELVAVKAQGFIYNGYANPVVLSLDETYSLIQQIAAPPDLFSSWGAYGGSIDLSSPSSVPIPSAIFLLGSGLLGLVGVSRKKRQK